MNLTSQFVCTYIVGSRLGGGMHVADFVAYCHVNDELEELSNLLRISAFFI
jgi:hypothetical protein